MSFEVIRQKVTIFGEERGSFEEIPSLAEMLSARIPPGEEKTKIRIWYDPKRPFLRWSMTFDPMMRPKGRERYWMRWVGSCLGGCGRDLNRLSEAVKAILLFANNEEAFEFQLRICGEESAIWARIKQEREEKPYVHRKRKQDSQQG